jgi:hypothetical protein
VATEGTATTGVATPLVASGGGIGEGTGTGTPPPASAPLQALVIDPTDSPFVLLNAATPDRGVVLTGHTFTAPQFTRVAASTVETEGDVLAATHVENRQITLEFDVIGSSKDNLRARMRALEQKVAKFADPARGGTLRWTLPTGYRITHTIKGVESYTPVYDNRLYTSNAASVQLVLTASPYGMGDPVTVGSWQSTTSNPVVTAAVPATVPGDVPALGSMRVLSAANLPGTTSTITWGIQGDADTTLPVVFEGEQQQPIGAGSVLTDSTASNGQAWAATVTTTDTPMFALRSSGSASLQHTGQFHVFARAGLLSGGNTQLQAMWWPGYRSDFASGAGGIPNPWVTVLSTTAGYSWVDLGVVDARPDPAFGGWGLVLRGRGVSGTSRVAIDNVFLVPTTDGYGQLISLLNQANDATITSDGARVTYNGATFDADLYFVDYFKVPAGVASQLVVRATSAKPLNEATGNFHDLPVPVTVSVTCVPRFLSMPG